MSADLQTISPGRSAIHLESADIFSTPDKWEYPWFAAWDLAFHGLPLAPVDPAFAKEQLLLLVDHRYQHSNGAIPAYEWAFGDVNPPVLVWAALRVFVRERTMRGTKVMRLSFSSRAPEGAGPKDGAGSAKGS